MALDWATYSGGGVERWRRTRANAARDRRGL